MSVRDVRNEQREPNTVAEATMNHPLVKPKTKPAIMTEVEYPIIGGKAQMKVKLHIMSHPPFKFRHFSAIGSSQPKIFSLKIKKRIPITKTIRMAIPASIFCHQTIIWYVEKSSLW